jgi:hypothetical protein
MLVASEQDTFFMSDDLYDLYRLPLTIGAVSLDNVVQIDAQDVDGKIQLELDINRAGITVTRKDGQPLQVQINERAVEYNPTNIGPQYRYTADGRIERRNVFLEPVESLRFSRAIASSPPSDELPNPPQRKGWIISNEDTEIKSVASLERFAGILGYYGFLKQKSLYRAPRLRQRIRVGL